MLTKPVQKKLVAEGCVHYSSIFINNPENESKRWEYTRMHAMRKKAWKDIFQNVLEPRLGW